MLLICRKWQSDNLLTVRPEDCVREVRDGKPLVFVRSAHCVFRLVRDRVADRLRVMPPEVESQLADLNTRITALQNERRELMGEAWRRADAYVVPK